MSNKNKTERMELPENKKTERMEIPASPPGPQSPSFTGSLNSGEVIKGYEVKSLISASTGEAEIFLAQKKDFKAIIKYYHANFKPKEDILIKFHNIDHPDIITLYEYGTHKGRFYEIMEYAEGGTLDDKNSDGTYKYLPMSEDGVKQIIDETINAFLFLHKEGVIHRDIKPGNLFYKNTDGSDLLIGDFGISSELDTEGGMSKRMTSTLALSEGYAAPELYGIAKDDNKVKILIGPEVDYYALGITVYELLTAINPFAGRNPLHIMRDTIEGRVADDILTRPEAKKISSQFQKLIRGLLTVRHEKRWKYNEVSRWLKGEAVEVFKEVQQQKIPALKFGEKTVNSILEMAEAIDADRDLAVKYLMRGMFEQWAMKFDESLANDIIDIKELQAEEESKISSLLFLLDPSLPCKLNDNIKVNTIPEFIELFRTKGELIGEVLFGGESTDVYAWLAVHSPELGEELKKAVSTFNKSDDKSPDELLKNIHQIYVSLAGERVKPFADSDLEVSSIEDLFNIPDNLKEKALEHLEIKNSILYLWLSAKDKNFNITKIKEDIKKRLLESFLSRAEEKISSKKFEEAILLLDSAIKLNPNNDILFIRRGYSKDQIGKIEEAIVDYTRAINSGTKDPDLYIKRIDAYCKIHKYAKAIDSCKLALKWMPDNPELTKKMELLLTKVMSGDKIKFGDQTISSIEKLSQAIDSDRYTAIQYLSCGIIDQWLTRISSPLAEEIAAIKNSGSSDEAKISKTIFKLNPSMLCRIDDSDTVTSVKELSDLLRYRPTLVFKQLLNQNSDLYNWLEINHNDYFKKVKVFLDTANKNLLLINAKTNQEIITDIYLTLCGDKIKPFPGEDYEISEVDDIVNIHNDYTGKVLKQLRDKNSIIYKWLLSKDIPEGFEQDWEAVQKTWENLIEILSGNAVNVLRDEKRIRKNKKRKERVQRFKNFFVLRPKTTAIMASLILFFIWIYWDNSIRTFKVHSESVNSASFSSDGRYALSGSDDKTLKLWDVSTSSVIRTFEGHSGSVRSVSISPDGRYALSGSVDGTLKLWGVSTGSLIRTFKGHSSFVKSVSFSPDGRYALSGSYDKTLKLWDVSTGSVIRTFKGHSERVLSVSFSPDGRYALSGSDIWVGEYGLKLWDVLTGSVIRTFKGHSGTVLYVSFSPDGRYALSGSWDGTLKLWEIDVK